MTEMAIPKTDTDYTVDFDCPFRNNRPANSENDEQRGALN